MKRELPTNSHLALFENNRFISSSIKSYYQVSRHEFFSPHLLHLQSADEPNKVQIPKYDKEGSDVNKNLYQTSFIGYELL